MTPDHHARGGATVGVMSVLEPWEARLIRHLRLWCEGSDGQSLVWQEYGEGLPGSQAQAAYTAFEALLRRLITSAHRPLVRHEAHCDCVGADEAILANLVRTAADGYLNDASLIATLMVGPAFAEQTALLAAQVGDSLRRLDVRTPSYATAPADNVVRLH